MAKSWGAFIVVTGAVSCAMLLGIACLPDYAFGVADGSETGPGADGFSQIDASGFDASGMARLDPTGNFTFDLDLGGNGRGPHRMGTLTHPFAIDKLEVTVGRYTYWIEHGHALPCNGCSLDQGGPYAAAMTWRSEWNDDVDPPIGTCGNGPADYGPPSTRERKGSPELPVTCVTWFDAAAFCASEGKRLATELEWMFTVTSGGKNLTFPWTNLSNPPLDCQHLIFDIDGDASTPGGNCNFLAAGPALAGGTEQGVLDMSGRVFEWIWDVGREFPDPAPENYTGPIGSAVDEKRVRRGGSFNSNTADVRLQNWYREKDFGANEPYTDLGFRCAKSL